MKHVVIGVSERVYDRLLLIAQADGLSLTDWVRKKLDVNGLEQLDSEKFETARKETDIGRMKRVHRELGKKLKEKAYVVKEWKSVKKERVVYFRTTPCTELEAVSDGHREKAGQYRLRIVVERTGHVKFGESRTFPMEEERLYYPSLKLYKKAVNRALGWNHLKVAKKAAPPAEQATGIPVP